jgi:hypothetical protein
MARFMRAGGRSRTVNGAELATPLHAYPSREANTVPEQGYERSMIIPFVDIQEPPRSSDEQGVGKTPGMGTVPWDRIFSSLVPKGLRMTSGSGNAPNLLTTPPRPERSGWGTDYLLYYEQKARHLWPGGGVGAPQHVIEHPATVPLSALAPRL